MAINILQKLLSGLSNKPKEEQPQQEETTMPSLDGLKDPQSNLNFDELNERFTGQKPIPSFPDLKDPKSNLSFDQLVDRFNKEPQKQEDSEDVPVISSATKSPIPRAPANAIKELDSAAVAKPKSPYGDDLSDDALKAEMANRNKLNLFATLNKAAARIGTGISGAKLDTSTFDDMEKRSGQGIEDIKTRRQAKDAELNRQKLTADLNDEDKLRDPNSEISIATRETAKLLGLKTNETTSAMALKNVGIDLGKLLVARESAESRKANNQMMLEMRKQQQEDLNKQRGISNVGKFQDTFNKDKVVEKARTGLASALDARELLMSNNPIADEAVKRSLARLSGEVGVLTDADVQSFGGSRALASKTKQLIQQAKDGKLSEENRASMLQLVDIFERKRQQQIQDRAMDLAKQGANRFGISEQEAFEQIMPGTPFPGNKKQQNKSTSSATKAVAPTTENGDEEMVKVQSPSGQVGSIPKKNLQKALDKGFKVI